MLFTPPSFYLILLARGLSILLLLSVNQFFIFFEGRPTAFIWSFFPSSLILAFNFLLFTLLGLFCYAMLFFSRFLT